MCVIELDDGRRRFAPKPTRYILCDSPLVCVPQLGVVDKDKSLAARTLLRPFTRLFADADFIPTRSFSPPFRIVS
jgi:hypothetical protein